ncbi:MAG: hypothetical protein DYG90_00360 [Chloroflexi bacterium CFX6]|nr:hypothetical protein [Chloroflexi bacterium CFX6]
MTPQERAEVNGLLDRPSRRPQTDDELHAWVARYLSVTIPRRACCDGHRAPFDAFADAYFARHPMTVWKASRGFGGKSMMLAVLALTEAATLGAEVRVLGGSADQSENVVRYTDDMVDSPAFPAPLLKPESHHRFGRRVSGLTKSRVSLATGGSLLATAASTRAARGPHPSRLRIDEADELSVTIFNAALGQTMAKRGVPAQTVVSSTHHYPDATMTEVLTRARKRRWPVYEWCWRETLRTADNPEGWLDPGEVERKRGEVPDEMWLTEYDLQEPSVEGRAINTDAVEAAFSADRGQFAGAAGEVIVLENPDPESLYVTGADWGRKRDWTIIATFKIVSRSPLRLRCVAWQREGRTAWPEMIAWYNRRLATYGGGGAHDGTGLGDVIEGYVDAPASVHLYCRVDDLYREGETFHPPDTFVAGALAYHAAREGFGDRWIVYDDED